MVSPHSTARLTRLERWFDAALGARKQKYGPNCNFFAIRDCFGAAKQGYRLEIAVNRPQNGLFSLCGNRRESLIEKKLQRSRNFCFYKGRTDPAGQILRKTRGAQQILRKTRGIAVTATRQVSARKKRLIAFLPVLSVVLAIQTRGFKVIAPLLISRVLVLSALIRAVAAGFLLLGEQCVLCRIACKK